jgi:hypothetical protein
MAGQIVLTAASSGTVTLTPADTGNAFVSTVPARTGNIAVDGPTFSAYQSSAQTGINSNAWNKIQFQTEEWDTANCFDSTTNYRFTPNVAGYYQVSSAIQVVNNTGPLKISIYKNGTSYKQGGYSTTTTFYAVSVSGIVYCNGTTDYIEAYVYSGGTANTGVAGIDVSYFQAAMVRAA